MCGKGPWGVVLSVRGVEKMASPNTVLQSVPVCLATEK